MGKLIGRIVLITIVLVAASCVIAGPYKWMKYDNFDRIMDKFASVTADNCRSKPQSELQLPEDSVQELPVYNKLLSTVYYQNRSSLVNLHNYALNRAFYYSFIYQALNRSNENDTVNFMNQPGLMYTFFSSVSDVSANAGLLNGSGIMFDFNCSYPNWLKDVSFNETIPLFGPKAWRKDDYNEPTNWLREPTNNTIEIWDLGAGRSSNYTHSEYKGNIWYQQWDMPDTWDKAKDDSVNKFTYTVGIKRSNATGKFLHDEFEGVDFFGPPQPEQQSKKEGLPVQWTRPYFDCGRSNRWIVTASSPVVEFMRRYVYFLHIRRPQYVAISTMDIEFERIDYNPCPKSEGNPGGFLADTARCKFTSTMCEPLTGFGFQRGGYQCVCNPGYYYPWWHDGPFLGVEIEQATEAEYAIGFECLPVQDRKVLPNESPTYVHGSRKRRSLESVASKFYHSLVSKDQTPSRRLIRRWVAKRSTTNVIRKKRFVPRYAGETEKIRNKRQGAFDLSAYDRAMNVISRFATTKRDNCHDQPNHKLLLPGDVTFGVKKQFESQGRTALRLAHFISNFMQNVDEYEEFGNMRGDRRLNETQIFGEVYATSMSDFKIVGYGAFFDRYKFRMSPPLNNTDPRFVNGITKEYFGPYGWKVNFENNGLPEIKVIDAAGFKKRYVDEPWFKDMKFRWASNTNALKKFIVNPMVRSDKTGGSRIRFEHYPIRYYAPQYSDGEWLRPHYICDEEMQIYKWVTRYVVPFFGLNILKTHLEFKGVIAVDVDLHYLDINQCPSDYDIANAFKNTARCDFQSTYCVWLEGKRFTKGSYKCECRQGYEYTFNDLAWYFDGQTMEIEFDKYRKNKPNRYETLRCRIAGSSMVAANGLIVVLVAAISHLFH